ncbi:hypothetical protein [Kutzneria sp. NPDC051319]
MLRVQIGGAVAKVSGTAQAAGFAPGMPSGVGGCGTATADS